MSQDTNAKEHVETSSTPASTNTGSDTSPQSSGSATMLRGLPYERQVAALTPPDEPVQRKGAGAPAGDVHDAAAHGISGGGGSLPHGDRIQAAFGGYDIGQVQAHTDSRAAEGSAAMGADAYATGTHIAFAGAPDLHTAAHEAAHVVQQQAGVQLSGGVGKANDNYEQHAEQVADAVVKGESAEPILATMAGPAGGNGRGVQQKAVQRKEVVTIEKTKTETKTETQGDRTLIPNLDPKTKDPASTSPALAEHEKDFEALQLMADALELAGEQVSFEITKLAKTFDALKAALSGVAPATTKAPDAKDKAPKDDPGQLSKAFRASCSGAKVRLTARMKEVVTRLSADLAKDESQMTVLFARYDKAVALSAEKRLVIDAMRTDFDAVKELHLAHFKLLTSPTVEVLKAYNGAERKIALKAAVAKVSQNRVQTEAWLRDYDANALAIDEYLAWLGATSLKSKIAKAQKTNVNMAGGIAIVSDVIPFGDENEKNQRKRLEGMLTQGRANNTLKLSDKTVETTELVDMVGLMPTLRTTFLHWLMGGQGLLGADVSSDAAAQLSPVHELGGKVSSAKGQALHDALATFVRKWGTAKTVMDEARGNSAIATAIAGLKANEPQLAVVCNEMLMTGQVVAFDATKLHVTLEKSDGSVTDGPVELRLEIIAASEKLSQEMRPPLAVACGLVRTLFGDVDAAMKAGNGLSPELFARYTAFVSRVGTNASVIKLLKNDVPTTYEKHFLPLVTMKVMSAEDVAAQKLADEKAAATVPTPGDTTPKTDLKLGGDNAHASDVFEKDSTGQVDDKQAKELADSHDQLSDAATDLKGSTKAVSDGKHVAFIFLAPTATKVAGVVGTPPEPAKVRYVLDRFHEENGVEFFNSDPFRQCTPGVQAEIKLALGIKPEATGPYAQKLQKLLENVNTLKGLHAMEAVKIAAEIETAMKAAIGIFADLPGLPAGTLDPAIAPSGRRPATPAMVFLNAYRFTHKVDFLAELRNVLNAWYATKWQSTVVAAVEAESGALRKSVSDHFGFDIENAGGDSAQKFDVKMTDKAEDKILGGVTAGKFVTSEMVEGKKVRDGFDDKVALRVADNIEGVLTANSGTEKKLAKTDKDARAGDIISYELLSGSMGGLLGVLGTSKADQQLMIAVQSLTFSERDAVDAAFRARYGRTMKAAFAEKGKAKETDDFFDLDANDAQAQAKWKLRIDAKRGAIKAVFEACASAAPDVRKDWLSDSALMSDLTGHIPEMDHLKAILSGDFNLYEAIKKKNGWVQDDEEGAKDEVGLYLKMHVATIKSKYPDATDPTKPKHLEHKAGFEAEHRAFLIKLATDTELHKALKASNLLSQNEIDVLMAKVLAGGKDDAKAGILKIWRDRTWYSGLDRKGLIAAVKALSDDDRPIIAKDIEVRAVVSQALKPTDQQLVFALLSGDKNAALTEMFVGKWWLTTDAAAIYTHILNMDFAAQQALKADDETLKGVLDAVGALQAVKLRELLGLTTAGVASTTETPSELSTATKKNVAQIDFYKRVLKERMLVAAKKGPNEAFVVANTIFKMKVAPATDTATADSMKKDDDFGKNHTDSNLGDVDNLLAMKLGGVSVTVREALAADSDIAAALKLCFGVAKPEYAHAVTEGLSGKSDPAVMMAEYHLRDKEGGGIVSTLSSLVTNATGIKDSLAAASDLAFLVEFTDIGKLAGLLASYAEHRDAEKYAIDDDAKKAAGSAKAAVLKQIRATRIEMSSVWGQRILQATSAQERKPIEATFNSRLIEILGSKAVADPGKVGTAAQAIFKLSNGSVSLDKDTITSVLAGTDLEARVKVDAAMQKQKDSSAGMDMFNKKNTNLLLDVTSSIGSVTNHEVAAHDKVTAAGLEKTDALITAADDVSKKIEARRDLIVSLAQKGGALGIAALSNFLLPGAPLWASVLITATKAVGGSLLKHGIKQAVHGSANYEIGKAVVLDVLAEIVSNSVAGLTDMASITKDGALKGGLLDQYPAVKFVFEKEVKALIAGTTGFLSDPVKMAEAYEKGWRAVLPSLKQSLWTEATAANLENVFKGKLDELIKKAIEMGLEEGQKFILGEDEEKAPDTIADTLDPSKDGKAVSRAEIEALAGAGIVDKVKLAYQEASASFGPTLMKHVPFAVFRTDSGAEDDYKEWVKWAQKGSLSLLASALKELPSLIDDPRQYVNDKNKAIAALGLPVHDRDQNTFIKRFMAFKASPFMGMVISKAMTDGTAVLEVFKAAWSRFSMASDLVEASAGNAGLMDDVVSEDKIKINRAAGFLKTLETRKKTTVWDGYNQATKQSQPTYDQYSQAFAELVSLTKGGGGDPKVVEDAVAKAVASNPSGLSDFLQNAYGPNSAEAKAAAAGKAKFQAAVAKAAQKAVEADLKKKAEAKKV